MSTGTQYSACEIRYVKHAPLYFKALYRWAWHFLLVFKLVPAGDSSWICECEICVSALSLTVSVDLLWLIDFNSLFACLTALICFIALLCFCLLVHLLSVSFQAHVKSFVSYHIVFACSPKKEEESPRFISLVYLSTVLVVCCVYAFHLVGILFVWTYAICGMQLWYQNYV